MKKMFSVQQANATTDLALLIARLGIAVLMLSHGIPKMQLLFSGTPIQFPGIMGLSPEISLGLAVFAEVICSVLILIGFGTRFATLPLISTMLVAVFVVHSADPFAKQEPALYFLLVYLVLLLAGSGKYSVDYLLKGKIKGSGYVFKNQSENVASYQ